MKKTCVFKNCKSCSRDKTKNFIPFPKPARSFEKCLWWVEIVNRKDLTINSINKYRYVCGKHFKNGKGPTEEYPDPEREAQIHTAGANDEPHQIFCPSLYDWVQIVEINSIEITFGECCIETSAGNNFIEEYKVDVSSFSLNDTGEEIPMTAVDIEHDYSRMDIVIKDIDNAKKEYELFVLITGNKAAWEIKWVNDVQNLMYSKELSPGKFVMITLMENLTITIKVVINNNELDCSHEPNTGKNISTLRDLLNIFYEFERRSVCEGIYVDPKSDLFIHGFENDYFCQKSLSLRSSNCEFIVKDAGLRRCKRCKQARKAMMKRKGRIGKRTMIHKNTPHRYLTFDDLKSQMKSRSKKIKLLSEKLKRLKAKIGK